MEDVEQKLDQEAILMRTRIEELIALNPVVVISKSTCPACDNALQAIKALSVPGLRPSVVQLDKLDSGAADTIQDHMLELTGARTVPRVFIDKCCIGGGDDTVRLAESGELRTLIEKALAKETSDANGVRAGFVLDKTDAEWKEQLGSRLFTILREGGTERPNSHEYNSFHPETGYFACAGCKLPVYSAASKFKSSCGWPVFDKCYNSRDHGCHVAVRSDGGGALEILCQKCGSHLGHVFFDAITPSNPNGERH